MAGACRSPALPQAAAEAIDWKLRLESGRASEADHRALGDWLARSPEHQAAWQRVNGLLAGAFGDIRLQAQRHPGLAHASVRALTAREPSRRRALGGCAAALAVGGTALWLADRQAPVGMLLAQYRSATAERRTLRLADGSRLTLDARSAADAHFSAGQRVLHLRAGAAAVRPAPDGQGRPFVLRTACGQVQMEAQAQGELVARLLPQCDRVSVLSGSAQLFTEGGAVARLREGEGADFDAGRVLALWPDARGQGAWLDGMLEARDESLEAVVQALRPYQRGVIRLSAEAARLRVFAVLSLDDPAQALRMLAGSLPITVRRLGPWLTLIDRR